MRQPGAVPVRRLIFAGDGTGDACGRSPTLLFSGRVRGMWARMRWLVGRVPGRTLGGIASPPVLCAGGAVRHPDRWPARGAGRPRRTTCRLLLFRSATVACGLWCALRSSALLWFWPLIAITSWPQAATEAAKTASFVAETAKSAGCDAAWTRTRRLSWASAEVGPGVSGPLCPGWSRPAWACPVPLLPRRRRAGCRCRSWCARTAG